MWRGACKATPEAMAATIRKRTPEAFDSYPQSALTGDVLIG